MGNYITKADISNQGNIPNARIESLIATIEKFFEWYCCDIFYDKSVIHNFDGNNKQEVFFHDLHDIVSCTKIESISYDGTATEIDEDSYIITPWSVSKYPYGLFEAGKRNYRFTGKVGHGQNDLDGNADEWYKPDAIKEACIITIEQIILEQFNNTASGGTGTSLPSKKVRYQSESISDYSYTLNKIAQATLDSSTPTGIPYVDMIIQPWRRDEPEFMLLDEQVPTDVKENLLISLYLNG